MARSSKTGGGKRGGGGAGGAGAKDIRAGGAFVELFTKDTALQRGLQNASKKLKSWSESMVKAGAATLGAGLGILTPVIGTLVSSINRAEKIGDLVDVFGLSADSASRMASAFEIAGGSIEELETSLGKLALKNTQGKPLDEFLLDTAKALGEVDDASERFKQASEIFGAKFARKFIDTGGDVGGLFGQSPALTQQQLNDAKAVRMEWTKTTIVLQNATLPILNAVGPSLKMLANGIRENAGLIPAIAAIGAGLAGAGVAVIGFGAALKVGSIALSGIAFLASPIGLVTAGIVAGTAAWLAYSESGKQTRTDLTAAWGAIVEMVSSGDLEGAMAVVTAAIDLQWARLTTGMESTWDSTLTTLSKALIAWQFATEKIFNRLKVGMASIGEQLGIFDKGATKTVFKDAVRDDKAALKAAIDNGIQLDAMHKEKLAALEANVAAKRAEFNKLIPDPNRNFGGFDFDFKDLQKGRPQLGNSVKGAFAIGNAQQQFGGGGSLAGQQLKQAEMQNKKLDDILVAFRNIPLARL